MAPNLGVSINLDNNSSLARLSIFMYYFWLSWDYSLASFIMRITLGGLWSQLGILL